ncbi:hypothetical protein, partial [Rhodovulum adriaticum]|uniref:hypothetical protein n=1 Tax=Rhodovulum adriaticum TaxID=35804 RepID=UPI001905D2B8
RARLGRTETALGGRETAVHPAESPLRGAKPRTCAPAERPGALSALLVRQRPTGKRQQEQHQQPAAIACHLPPRATGAKAALRAHLPRAKAPLAPSTGGTETGLPGLSTAEPALRGRLARAKTRTGRCRTKAAPRTPCRESTLAPAKAALKTAERPLTAQGGLSAGPACGGTAKSGAAGRGRPCANIRAGGRGYAAGRAERAARGGLLRGLETVIVGKA